jgi:hypothetical protein
MQINDAIKSLRLLQLERKLLENSKKIGNILKPSNDFSWKNEDFKFLLEEIKRLNKVVESSKDNEILEFTEDFLKSSIGSVEWEDLRQRAKSILRKHSKNV